MKPGRNTLANSKYFSSKNLTQIDEHLFLGNVDVSFDSNTLSKLKIKSIVQLVEAKPNLAVQNSIKFLKIPIRGGRNTDVRPILVETLRFIHSGITSCENVLVHCKHGKNRSASVVVAYIMAVKNLECVEALQYVVERRPIVKLKPQTIQYLQDELGAEGIRKIIF